MFHCVEFFFQSNRYFDKQHRLAQMLFESIGKFTHCVIILHSAEGGLRVFQF